MSDTDQTSAPRSNHDSVLDRQNNSDRDRRDSGAPSASAEPHPFADADLIVPPHLQPSSLTRFLIKQSSSFDPQYFTKDEGGNATILTGAKFLSVTWASVAFTKVVAPVFEVIGDSVEFLGSSPKAAFAVAAAGTTFGLIWWGLSKLDTGVLGQVRMRKAAMDANERGRDVPASDLRSNLIGLAFRIGISTASLGITLPPMMVLMTQTKANQYVQRTNVKLNAPVVDDYKNRLQAVETTLTNLRQTDTNLQNNLRDLQNPGLALTTEQVKRLETLRKTLETLEAERIEQAKKLEKLEAERDAAETRMNVERLGSRGRPAGEKKQFREAKTDYDQAAREIETLQTAIKRNAQGTQSAQTEVTNINNAGKDAMVTRDANLDQRKATVSGQIADVQQQIKVKEGERTDLKDFEGLAKRDARYVEYKPTLDEQFKAYVQYMSNEADTLEWSRQLLAALFITCMELGVFALAASRSLNSGERRAYLANLLKSEEANNKFQQVTERMAHDIDVSSVALANQRTIAATQRHMMRNELRKIQSDPAVLRNMADHILFLMGRMIPDEQTGRAQPESRQHPQRRPQAI